MSKVSVLVPTYKPNPQHLSEALESLRGQTETDWECIICDEPTDTDTHAMVMDYMVDERFSFHKNEKCLGIGGNWNECYSKSSSDVITYLFQDDLWEPDYLETALQIFSEHHDVGLISMHHKYQYDEDLWTIEGYELVKEVQKELGDQIEYCNSVEDSTIESDGIVLVTEWDEFRNVDFLSLGEKMKNKIVFDGRNIYEPEMIREDGFDYVGVGRR